MAIAGEVRIRHGARAEAEQRMLGAQLRQRQRHQERKGRSQCAEPPFAHQRLQRNHDPGPQAQPEAKVHHAGGVQPPIRCHPAIQPLQGPSGDARQAEEGDDHTSERQGVRREPPARHAATPSAMGERRAAQPHQEHTQRAAQQRDAIQQTFGAWQQRHPVRERQRERDPARHPSQTERQAGLHGPRPRHPLERRLKLGEALRDGRQACGAGRRRMG